MKRILMVLALCAGSVLAQTSETLYFQGQMLPSSEVPATDLAGTALGTVSAHVVKDSSGQILWGTVEFLVDVKVTGTHTVTGLHVHPGNAGTNGPVVISSGLTTQEITGNTYLRYVTVIPPSNTAGVTALRNMVQNPGGHYINIHTSVFPGGAMRAQLQKAEFIAWGTLLSPQNETPALPLTAGSGRGVVYAIVTRNPNGSVATGLVALIGFYNFGEQKTITGFHIHEGAAGVAGPVTISSGIPAQVPTPASGIGAIAPITNPFGQVSLDMSVAAQARTINGMIGNPAGYYMNIHTTEFPGGVIRGQLRLIERVDFPVRPSSANEVPAISGLDAEGVGQFTLGVLRAEDGSVEWAVYLFDANFRFPTGVTLTGMHVHTGVAGVNGAVVLDSALARTTSDASGYGNLFQVNIATTGTHLAGAEGVLSNPEAWYFNIHTSDNPGGAIRTQLLPVNTEKAAISAIVSANLDTRATTLAPGGLFTIYGRNLAKVTGSLAGWQGRKIPEGLNGVAVGAGALRPRLLYVSATQINAQLPPETSAGSTAVAVDNGNGASAGFPIQVARTAPAIFSADGAGIVVKNADFSLITAANPAAAGDVLVIYSTGLGATSPALESGTLTPGTGQYNTADATVTVGGQTAEVIYSIASPGLVGVYQTAFRMPSGVGTGARPLVLTTGGVASNAVNIMAR
jgi:uncharacterized protein (TIGR03437 family)